MICVVGGANVDIVGTANANIIMRDSNPGRIVYAAGGVGRNMAESFRRMGMEVMLVTALGMDENAQFIRANCAQLGIDLTHAFAISEARTSTYLCINGADGDLVLAISDMDVCDRLSPERLSGVVDVLNACEMCVLDANLSKSAIDFLATSIRVKIAADPVSVAKAPRLSGVLNRLTLLKPNLPEAERLTGLSANTCGVAGVAQALYNQGVKNVFLSLGAEGVYYMDAASEGHLPVCKGPIVDTTGCGDAFLAAAAMSILSGLTAYDAAKRALAAAALHAASKTVSETAIDRALQNGGIQ